VCSFNSAIWEKTWTLLTVQVVLVDIKIRMKNLAALGVIKDHTIEE
jgi:DNA-binding MltR family transcriptional regulator